jgi:hypothetical protein
VLHCGCATLAAHPGRSTGLPEGSALISLIGWHARDRLDARSGFLQYPAIDSVADRRSRDARSDADVKQRGAVRQGSADPVEIGRLYSTCDGDGHRPS